MSSINIGYHPPKLTSCDTEPVHLIGRIQKVACAIVFSDEGLVQRASTNVEDFLNLDPAEMIGRRLDDVLPESAARTLLHLAADVAATGRSQHAFDTALAEATGHFDITVYASEESFVAEIEAARERGDRDGLAGLRGRFQELRDCPDQDSFLETAVRHISELSGFSRVKAYLFDNDGSGEVVAEINSGSMESYLGLRFPASDIPAQARELLLRSTVRPIANVSCDGARIIPEVDLNGRALDLTNSPLRTHSPIHRKYLENMGVAATLTVSLICRERLVGLLSCHHPEPRHMAARTRAGLELYGQCASSLLEAIRNKAYTQAQETLRNIQLDHSLMLAKSVADFGNIVHKLARAISANIDCDGYGVFLDGRFHGSGASLTEEEFHLLEAGLNTVSPQSVFACSELGAKVPTLAQTQNDIAGVLALPVSRRPRDYILFFRKTVSSAIKWAGDPSGSKEIGEAGRLIPRVSFRVFLEERTGCSKPWSEHEIAMAEAMRSSLVEIVLRLTDAKDKERVHNLQKQELLISELNHRVRNILALIQNLVEQSAEGASSVSDFTKVVGGRLHSMAKAHDLVTRKNWEPISLTELINNEISGFGSVEQSRVRLDGEDVLITPQAATTVALTLHELATNAVKYGALSTAHGNVKIRLSNVEGDTVIRWRELGGPAVQQFKSLGFGTTLIEEAIPHDLGGRVTLDFAMAGITAILSIPRGHILGAAKRSEPKLSAVQPQPEMSLAEMPKNLLLVEDHLLLAKGQMMHLLRAGVGEVKITGSVAAAFSEIEASKLDFAILDYNLGNETSLPIAERLAKQGVPFIFLTGYDTPTTLAEIYPQIVVETKPVTSSALIQKVGEVFRAGFQTPEPHSLSA